MLPVNQRPRPFVKRTESGVGDNRNLLRTITARLPRASASTLTSLGGGGWVRLPAQSAAAGVTTGGLMGGVCLTARQVEEPS